MGSFALELLENKPPCKEPCSRVGVDHLCFMSWWPYSIVSKGSQGAWRIEGGARNVNAPPWNGTPCNSHPGEEFPRFPLSSVEVWVFLWCLGPLELAPFSGNQGVCLGPTRHLGWGKVRTRGCLSWRGHLCQVPKRLPRCLYVCVCAILYLPLGLF